MKRGLLARLFGARQQQQTSTQAGEFYVRVWSNGIGTPLLFRGFLAAATPSHAAAIGIMRTDVSLNRTFMVCVEQATMTEHW